MSAALRVWWRLRTAAARDGRLPDVLAVVAFAVATAALLIAVAGMLAFHHRNGGTEDPIGSLYVSLAMIGSALLAVPVMTLGGVAARLAANRRNERMAALRLTGATSAQVTAMTLAEAATQALAGAVAGVMLFALSLIPLSHATFQGRPFPLSDLWPGTLVVAGVVLVVTVLAVVSGLVGLARVVISPLGVANRTTPGRLGVFRAVVAVAALVAWAVVTKMVPVAGVMVAVIAVAVATINLVGPLVIQLVARIIASAASSPQTLLAARRMDDDPRATWRAVGSLGIGIMLAGMSAAAPSFPATDAQSRMLGHDIGLGSLLVLVILFVVSATSTGVTQAARVLEQRTEYRQLTMAGAAESTLHQARMREVLYPAVITIALAGAFTTLLLLPMAAGGPFVFVRFGLAVAAAAVLTVLAMQASRSLVREACRLDA